MKFKLELEIDTPEWMFDESDPREIAFYKKIILGVKDLHLHSNEIGDEIGKIKSAKIISFNEML